MTISIVQFAFMVSLITIIAYLIGSWIASNSSLRKARSQVYVSFVNTLNEYMWRLEAYDKAVSDAPDSEEASLTLSKLTESIDAHDQTFGAFLIVGTARSYLRYNDLHEILTDNLAGVGSRPYDKSHYGEAISKLSYALIKSLRRDLFLRTPTNVRDVYSANLIVARRKFEELNK